MQKLFACLLLLVTSTSALADSITIGSKKYENVYVGTDENYYYIHFPDEGRLEKISRKRKEVRAPEIDPDSGSRNALKKRFDENRERVERQNSSSVSGTQLTSKDFEVLSRNKTIALFDAQLEQWKALSPLERRLVQKNLSNHAEGSLQSYAISKSVVDDERGQLENEKSDHEARLSALEQQKQSAIDEADRENASDIFMEEYQKSLLERQMGRRSFLEEHWREAAEVEDAYAAIRKSDAQRSFEQSAAPHERAVSKIDSDIVQKERDSIAIENMAIDSAKRIAVFDSRLTELTNAINMLYMSELEPVIAFSWSDSISKKSIPFSIDAPFWRLDCLRDDFGQAGAFSITVYDAETNRPFTRLGDVDFLQMRVRVLDGPGRYYLVIEQDESGIPYEIRAVTFAE